MEENLNSYIREAIVKNWDRLALTDFDGSSYQFSTVARKIEKLHILLSEADIKPGDKIALCGKNSAEWAVAFLAIVTYGAVAVPILHEFHSENIHNIVDHSDARILFCDTAIWHKLDVRVMPKLEGVIAISDYSLLYCNNESLNHGRETLNELFGKKYPERFVAADIVYYTPRPEELALINYTSGSTGFSKGVMLPYRALFSNLKFCCDRLNILVAGDSTICMLPLAHMYGLVVELLFPFAMGCHVHFLTKVPSPKVLLDAFARVRPKVVITVPLVIEKIIKSKVFPTLQKPLMKVLLNMPVLEAKILKKVRAKIIDAFGGELQELIIGGAAISKDVEVFLRKIHFPYTVGYGMTECAPLIAYEDWDKTEMKACGRCVDRMELRVDSPDPAHVPGELWVRGDNLMIGYYKNPEATQSSMRDGWFNTGDICTVDDTGLIYINGRSKNMILGPSGQNIYPEEIEQKINNMPYVNESIVVDDNGSIVALIHPDVDAAEKQRISYEELEKMMKENVELVNKELPAYSRIKETRVYKEEFEKTPKRSIKRYLYQPKTKAK